MVQDKILSSNRAQLPLTLRLRVEHQRDAFGIGTNRPRLSWIVETERQGWHPAAYEIESYGANGKLSAQTGRVDSDQSVLVDWPFEPLSSRGRLSVRLRVRGRRIEVPRLAFSFRKNRCRAVYEESCHSFV